MNTILILFVIAVVGWAVISSHLKKERLEARREALYSKYGDYEVVDKLMGGGIWQGQSAEQLTDSLGKPVDVDLKVLKTKSKEIWKYAQTGRGRYALRVTVENDVVVGWDKKA